MNLTAESLPAQLPAMRAANDESMHDRADSRVGAPSAAWDPYEVWRTRVLPYQRLARTQAAALSKMTGSHTGQSLGIDVLPVIVSR